MSDVLTETLVGEPVSMCEYADFEIECPFCECNHLSINVELGDTEYKCSNCGGEWNVLEK